MSQHIQFKAQIGIVSPEVGHLTRHTVTAEYMAADVTGFYFYMTALIDPQ
ncbi:hypothetical protein ABF227_003017 [Yersinia ruckeri]